MPVEFATSKSAGGEHVPPAGGEYHNASFGISSQNPEVDPEVDMFHDRI
jgi:hypothetical protein